jgi:hypothetical protein
VEVLAQATIDESIFEGIDKLKEANINVIWQTGKNFDSS